VPGRSVLCWMIGRPHALEVLDEGYTQAVVTVLITGWELPDDDDRLKPFDFVIQKPIDLDEFEDTIARAIHLHDQRK